MIILKIVVIVDETVDSWFLMNSPGPVFSIVGFYLILVLKVGPAFMKNRKPFQLKNVLVAYNAFQVCYSIFMCRTVISLDRSRSINVQIGLFSFQVYPRKSYHRHTPVQEVRDNQIP